MDIAEVKDVESFDKWLAERNLSGLWGRERSGDFKPWLWKWDDIHTALEKAGEVIGLDFVNRRDVNLVNPTTKIGRPSKTVSGTLQYLMPGDVARAHRHSAATARWVVAGDEGAYSVVEGEAFPVLEGDLLVAPSMAWHDHYHKGTKPTIWLSSLDNQFTQLTHSFGENYPEEQQPVEKPEGWSALTAAAIRAKSVEQEFVPPPYRYRWADTYASLMALKAREDVDPYDGIRVDFRNPVDGGPTFPTMTCSVQLLSSHEVTRAHRHNSTVLYQAFRGNGVTVVDGQRFEWNQGDIFVVPPWALHHHENGRAEDSILYSISDEPVWRALNLYREDNSPADG
jgi:gentisate 1,2-dioxygenase